MNNVAFYTVSGVALLIFVILSAFFSSAEIAFAKCNRLRLEKAAENGDKTAGTVMKICDNYTGVLSTILAGNNLVNIAASSLATLVAIELLGKARGETVSTVVMTAVILLFGETVPKITAAAVPDKIARLYARPVMFFVFIFKPLVFAVNKFTFILSKLWTPKEKSPEITGEELCEILEDIEDEGVFSEDESELIKSAIEFTDTLAKDILVPRVDVTAIDIDEPFELTDSMYKHTRIPVYRENIDNIIGVLSTKQVLREIAAGRQINIAELMHEPVFVHLTRTVSSILEEFRKTHSQLAVVVDEYGGTAGILTLEDITEEIVGDIFDEKENAEPEITQIADGVFEAEGGANIFDIFDYMDYDEPQDFDTEYTTVGGWSTEVLDKFPEPGDSFEYDRLKVTVTKAEAKRVLLVKIELKPEDEDR